MIKLWGFSISHVWGEIIWEKNIAFLWNMWCFRLWWNMYDGMLMVLWWYYVFRDDACVGLKNFIAMKPSIGGHNTGKNNTYHTICTQYHISYIISQWIIHDDYWFINGITMENSLTSDIINPRMRCWNPCWLHWAGRRCGWRSKEVRMRQFFVTNQIARMITNVACSSSIGHQLMTEYVWEYNGWLVVFFTTPLQNDGVRQLGWLATQYMGKFKKWQPNHQPDGIQRYGLLVFDFGANFIRLW